MSLLLECYYDVLLESKRDDFLLSYVDMLNKKGIEINLGQLKSALLNKFSTEFGIHSLSLGSNFYLNGVTRYYFEGVLTSNKRLNLIYSKVTDKPLRDVCDRLDKLIEILRNSYIDSVGTKFEQPEDFGTLPLDKLLKKYKKKIDLAFGINQGEIESTKKEVDMSNKASKNYSYDILYSYDDAQKYCNATSPGSWCITYGQQHYNAYIRRLDIHYVVFYRKNYENIPRQVGKGFTKRKPHDEYGNSLICVLQSNKNPKPIYITSRWNHGYGETQGTEADYAYTTEEFLDVVGCDYSVLERVYEQWKNTLEKRKEESKFVAAKNKDNDKKALRDLKYAQMMISGGADPKEFFQGGRCLVGNPQKPYKGICWVQMQGEGNNYYACIMDKKNLRLDRVFKFSSPYNTYSFLKNGDIIICSDDKDIMSLYSVRWHKFLDADGVKKFKMATYDFRDRSLGQLKEKSHYFMVGASKNQWAVVDMKTANFLKTPNGATIFEAVHNIQSGDDSWEMKQFRRTNDGATQITDRGYLYLMYDSAANEYYIYDLERKEWIDTKTIEKDSWQVSLDATNVDGYIKCEHHGGTSEQDDGYHNFPITFFSKDFSSKFSVGGFDTFRLFEKKGDLIKFQPWNTKENGRYGDYCYLYDITTQSYISYKGEPLYGRVSINKIQGYAYIFHDENYHKRCFFYDMINHELMYNEYMQSYTFYMSGERNGLIHCIDPNTKTNYDVPTPRKKTAIMKQSYKEEFEKRFKKLIK